MRNNKPVLKAYKVAFPSLSEYGFIEGWWNYPHLYEGVIYGKSQKEAVNKRCLADGLESFWTLKQAARTKRHKTADLYSQTKSALLNGLSNEEINHLTHSLGVTIGDRCPESFYRNYSVYHQPNQDYKELLSRELVELHTKFNQHVYTVTSKGQEAVRSLLLMTKEQLEAALLAAPSNAKGTF